MVAWTAAVKKEEVLAAVEPTRIFSSSLPLLIHSQSRRAPRLQAELEKKAEKKAEKKERAVSFSRLIINLTATLTRKAFSRQ